MTAHYFATINCEISVIKLQIKLNSITYKTVIFKVTRTFYIITATNFQIQYNTNILNMLFRLRRITKESEIHSINKLAMNKTECTEVIIQNK